MVTPARAPRRRRPGAGLRAGVRAGCGPGPAGRGPGAGPGGREAGGREAVPDSWAAQVEGPVLVDGGNGGLTALRGGPFLHRAAAGRTWRTSAGVFWQVHPAAADVLAGVVQDVLRPAAR